AVVEQVEAARAIAPALDDRLADQAHEVAAPLADVLGRVIRMGRAAALDRRAWRGNAVGGRRRNARHARARRGAGDVELRPAAVTLETAGRREDEPRLAARTLADHLEVSLTTLSSLPHSLQERRKH